MTLYMYTLIIYSVLCGLPTCSHNIMHRLYGHGCKLLTVWLHVNTASIKCTHQLTFHLAITDSGTSHSAVGRQAEKKPVQDATMTLNLATDHQRRTILHEFGHALGLRHEHQRRDRPGDLYRVQPTGKKYQKYSQLMDKEKDIWFEYDVDSVMHYRSVVYATCIHFVRYLQ